VRLPYQLVVVLLHLGQLPSMQWKGIEFRSFFLPAVLVAVSFRPVTIGVSLAIPLEISFLDLT
jgi:hypothetical protein